MTIYVDADACPKAIKEILFKAAKRTQIPLVLVANQALTIPRHPSIQAIQVDKGFDVADHTIASKVNKGDLVITADIPLADEVIQKQALALNPRGYLYNQDNIKQRLSVRNMLETMRTSGIQTGGPPSISARDIQQFANALDRYLSKAQ